MKLKFIINFFIALFIINICTVGFCDDYDYIISKINTIDTSPIERVVSVDIKKVNNTNSNAVLIVAHYRYDKGYNRLAQFDIIPLNNMPIGDYTINTSISICRNIEPYIGTVKAFIWDSINQTPLCESHKIGYQGASDGGGGSSYRGGFSSTTSCIVPHN